MVTTAAIREHYDSFAFIYRAFWGDHIHHGFFRPGEETPEQAQEALLDYCAAAAQVRNGGRVLDVGCGHGATAIYLASRFACQVRGLTLSQTQVRIARKQATRAGVQALARFAVGDAEQVTLPRAAFDLLWTMESSEHFHDKPAYFRRAAAALAPGGRLLLAAWTGSMDNPQVRDVASAFLCPELQTADEYSRQLAAAGLKVCHRADLTSQVQRTWEICVYRARLAAPMARVLPRPAREFVEGVSVILNAYRSGALSYTVLCAQKVGLA
jgi:tocopherol O-methyltransferase